MNTELKEYTVIISTNVVVHERQSKTVLLPKATDYENFSLVMYAKNEKEAIQLYRDSILELKQICQDKSRQISCQNDTQPKLTTDST